MDKEIEWLLKDKYSGEKSEAFFADCKRLALGEPLGYLIGHVPFLGCTIYLDSRPLIPRPETEFWCEKAIEVVKSSAKQPRLFEAERTPVMTETRSEARTEAPAGPASARSNLQILDMCAGSGCIGVAVAKHIPEAIVDFSEIAADHIPTIKKNLEKNNIQTNRTEVFQTSLFNGIDKKYDFILANPPYIDSDKHTVDQSVVDFEPHLALFGGRGGIEIISQIIAAAPDHLTSGGQLWLEHEPEQSSALAGLAREHGFSITTEKDQYGIERYSILVLQ